VKIGDRLGPYEILALIGAGGMGEVYKARDTRLDRIVAVKISKTEFSERFEREARAIATLNHPQICQLYDVGPNYLVMEYIEGTPLKGPLPLGKAVECAGQILDALNAAHKSGITHRDLKPANILITKSGIKLLDFGLAKQNGLLKETDATKALTGPGEILGTLQYMSPEQLQGKEADARSDLFSFGSVLYEMLTGKGAFQGQTAASVIAAILEREPAPLSLSPPLERVIKRSLAKDPDQRFQTARDLKVALDWAAEESPGQPKPGKRWWMAAAGLLIGAGAVWAVGHVRPAAKADERVLRLEIEPPEGGRFVMAQDIGGAALSPDGKNLAFVAAVNGQVALWIRPLDEKAARLIAGTEGATDPFWSPDGKSVAFFADGKLQRMDLAGGTPSIICNASAGRGGVWAPDGRILFATQERPLSQVSALGGVPASLTALDTSRLELLHYWPQILPHGRFSFWVRSQAQGNDGIYASSFGNPNERVKLASNGASAALQAEGGDGKQYLLWLRGATLVAQELDPGSLKLDGQPYPIASPVSEVASTRRTNATVSRTGMLVYDSSTMVSQLTWFDRSGKPLTTMGDAAKYTTFRLSPDNRRVAASREAGSFDRDLWVVDVERSISSRLSLTPGVHWRPVWSPDGQFIAFSGPSRNLELMPSNGGGAAQQLLRSPRIQNPTDWSLDGRFILYFEPAQGNDALWVLPIGPDGKASQPRNYLGGAFDANYGRFSPQKEPHWVAYQSDESGRWEIYIQSFPEPHGKIQVSSGGGQYPEWGPNGSELFYASLDGKLMAVNLKVEGSTVKPAAAQELFPLPPSGNADWPFHVASDGQRFLVNALKQQAQSLTLVVNWPALLKRGAVAP